MGLYAGTHWCWNLHLRQTNKNLEMALPGVWFEQKQQDLFLIIFHFHGSTVICWKCKWNETLIKLISPKPNKKTFNVFSKSRREECSPQKSYEAFDNMLKIQRKKRWYGKVKLIHEATDNCLIIRVYLIIIS